MRTETKVQTYITKVLAALIILLITLSINRINFVYSNPAFYLYDRYITAQAIEDIGEVPSQEPDIIDKNPEEGIVYEYRKGMVSAGLYHTVLVNEKGKVFTWGDNTYGQLGLGTLENAESPTEVFGLNDVIAVSAGSYHSMALTSDGNLYLWGRNSFGQIGNKSTETILVPVRISGIPPVKEISAGALHSLALTINGDVYGWGSNTYGQVGDVVSEEIIDEAQNVLGLRVTSPEPVIKGNFVSVSAGGFHSLALMRDGSVFAWGDNTYGQLGDGTTQSRSTPQKTQILNSIVQISAGYHHNFAIARLQKRNPEYVSEEASESGTLSDNETSYYRSLYAWGSDATGQLGLGALTDGTGVVLVPRRVNVTGDANPENDNVQIASAGFFNSLATVMDESSDSPRDSLYVWGNNTYGQLGIGSLPSRNIPLKLAGSSNGWTGDSFLPFQSISAGGYHTVLLSVKGFLGTMGRADKGQLGNTSIINSDIPVGIPVEDAISPEWKVGETIRVEFIQTFLLVGWKNARDNIKVTGYEINYTDFEDNPVTITVKENELSDSTEYLIRDIDIKSSQIITVFALDAQGNKSTGPLRYYLNSIPDADIDIRQPVQNPNINDRFSWSAELYGEIEKLEVPWDVDHIYGIGVVMPPKDNTLIIAILITLFVMAFFLVVGILAFRRNHKDIRIFGEIIRFRSSKYFKENDKKSISEYNGEETEISEKKTEDIADDSNSDISSAISIEITENEDVENSENNKTSGIMKFFKKKGKDKK